MNHDERHRYEKAYFADRADMGSRLNRDLLLRIADVIEREPQLYDQRYFSTKTECGTAHCIAGWALKLAGIEVDFIGAWPAAEKLLGLNEREANLIFGSGAVPLNGMTMAEALRAIANGYDVDDCLDLRETEDDHDD